MPFYRKRKVASRGKAPVAQDRGQGTAPAGDPPADCSEPNLSEENHRDGLAGMWAAELLGLIGHAAQDYARELTQAPVPPEGASEDGDHVIRRLARDLHGRMTAQEIRHKLYALLHPARRQRHPDDDAPH